MKQFPLNEQQLLDDLKGLLRIKSVNGDCGEVSEKALLGAGINEAIEYMLALGKKFGFKTKNLDGCCGWIEMGQGDQMVGILAHMDTVSVDENGWVANPFDGTLIDGKLYGRGVIDDKGPAMVALYAMKTLADSGANLGKRVRLILGGDEEAGDWRCMTRYKQTEETPSCAFTPDAEYPTTFAEKGILHVRIFRHLDSSIRPISLDCGKMFNIVPAYAAATVDGVAYEATGVAAHAMEPHKGVNALLKLCDTLREKGIDHPFVKMAEIANLDGFHIRFSDEPSGALTLNPSIAKVTDSMAELFCDIRVPVTVDVTKVVQAISDSVAPLGFTAENTHYSEPLYVEKDSPLVSTLQRVYLECTGEDIPSNSTGGGTYARAFDNAVAFGPMFPGEEVTYHQTNEYWAVDSMRRNYQIFVNTIKALAENA
ncbi:Sapep family Mn(2+)-dependent dipeptidase [Oscillospiraceae bacterium PP1C4]